MALRLAALYPDLPRCVLVGGANDQLGDVEAMSSSEGYKAWYNAWVAWLRDLKTQTHEERLVSSLHQLPPGAPLPPEDEYVAMVESSARVDLGLVELGPSLWSLRKAQFEEVKALQERITCPVLLMYSGYFSVPGAPQALREEPSTQPNVKIVRFENAGHMIYRERFDQFIDVVQRFLREH
jgi:pimeloyl-ACP methyl ester carboxylesterase